MDDVDGKTSRAFAAWVDALERRHMSELRLSEIGRALRALSSAYVERRSTLVHGSALDTAGKRAAFALFYAPIHFLTTWTIVRALGEAARPPDTVVDLGCGTGAAGAAWALCRTPPPRVLGLDRHRWAIDEAQWTYRQLGLSGTARSGDAARFRLPRGKVGVVAAYVLNELPQGAREATWKLMKDAAGLGPMLVIEPISRAVTPWWDAAAAEIIRAGGRADEWRFAVDLPPLVRQLDHSAGLDHREISARTLLLG